ncbi:MAG: hypothetical protein ACXWUG_20325 [Polyangiales bacterium]
MLARFADRVNAWDLRLAARTVALSAVAVFALVLIESITNERGVGTPGTSGSIGLLPLVPIAAAIAATIAVAPAETSGELRALLALGCSPWRARAGALAVSMSFACGAGAILGIGTSDIAALFPAPIAASDYRVELSSEGPAFVSPRRGTLLRADDVFERAAPPTKPPPPPSRTRAAGGLAIAAAGIALTLFGVAPVKRRAPSTLLVIALWATCEVAAFQLAGAGAITPFVTVLPSIALAAVAFFVARRASTLLREESWL